MSRQTTLDLGLEGCPDIRGKRPAAFNPKKCPGQAPNLSGRTSPDMSGSVRLCPGTKESRAAAFKAWLDAGQPWNPDNDQPPGAVLNHALDACRDKGRGFRW